MKIAIFANHYHEKKPETEQHILAISREVEKLEMKLYLPESLFLSLSRKTQDAVRPLCLLFDVLPPVDLALSIGGDGTFLRTAAIIGDNNIPILGINTGRLGFLADINCLTVDATLLEIAEGKYRVEERSLLELFTADEMITPFENNTKALNEIAILKQDTASMLVIHAYINGEYLTTYQSDGVVVSTPTGSTAYALSIGGPILTPTSPSLILAAIAPHSLTARPLVVDDKSSISLKVESRSRNYLVSIDGQSQVFHERTALEIRKAGFTLKVVKRLGHTFFETLRDKLMWGADVRI